MTCFPSHTSKPVASNWTQPLSPTPIRNSIEKKASVLQQRFQLLFCLHRLFLQPSPLFPLFTIHPPILSPVTARASPDDRLSMSWTPKPRGRRPWSNRIVVICLARGAPRPIRCPCSAGAACARYSRYRSLYPRSTRSHGPIERTDSRVLPLDSELSVSSLA